MWKRSPLEWALMIGGGAMVLAGLATLTYVVFAIHVGIIGLSTRAANIVVTLDRMPLVFTTIVFIYSVAAGIFFWLALRCLR
jgi:hypothetical protein